ncbi:MAG: GGDEF domain-containing protein [Proteobacteria bacterium]|nr:GGDEF domain-containing protein [Pseudomonadota bacterium]
MIDDGRPFTPGTMAGLHSEFFNGQDLGQADRSRELRRIAADLVERIAAARSPVDDYGSVLRKYAAILDTVTLPPSGLQQATAALKTATREVNTRMAALEQLFQASLVRISELQATMGRLEKDAATDALTGLANRRAFDLALLQATAQCAADGTEIALLLLDIDHFKRFNDLHGHTLGDHVLRLVGQVLIKHIKGRDTAARYGGEEFAIILVQAGFSAAMTIAEQIRVLLESSPLLNKRTGGNLGAITCSIGVSVYRPAEAPSDLVDRADQLLYRAKQAGRNQVCGEG